MLVPDLRPKVVPYGSRLLLDLITKGFKVLPKRLIVERTFSWLIRNRRLSKDYERKVQTSETLVKVAAIRLILRRLARKA
jgi:putative transposase